MATIAKKKRKTGAKKTRKRKVSGTAASGTTMTINGLRFTKKGCSTTKTGAKQIADKSRAAGNNARTIKSGTGYCVYTRRKTA